MRNTKKLIAVIMTIAILASMMVPALAASYQTEADKLMAVGLMKGTGDGADLEMALDRIQGITFTIRAMGVEKEALAMTEAEIAAALENVTDADTIPAWGRAYAAYAVKSGLTNGVSATEFVFAPFAKLSGTQFITMMLRALGYTGVTLDNCLEKAIAAGMLTAGKAVEFGKQDQLLRDGAAFVIFNTAKNGLVAEKDGVTPSDMTLIGKLVADGVIAATVAAANFDYDVPEAGVTAAFTFTAVALNAIQFKLTPDQALNEDDAVDEAFYAIKDKVVGDAALQADGSVILTITNYAPFGNNSTAEITLKKDIRNAAGIKNAADYTVKDVAVFDTTFPTFDSVEAVGLKTLRLHFSEPVWTGSNTTMNVSTGAITTSSNFFEVKNDTYTWTVVSSKVNLLDKYVELTLGTNLIEGNVNVKTKNALKDFAGNLVAEKTIAYTFVKDSTAPVASIKSAAQKEVVVKFNKPVYGSLVVAHSNKSVDAYKGWYGTPSTQVAVVLESAATDEFTFSFVNNPLPSGNVTLYVLAADDTDVKDLYGNKLVETVLTATVSLDTTAPTVSSTELKDKTSYKVTFNEKIDEATAEDESNYTLKKADGTTVYFTATLDAGDTDKVLTIDPVSDFADHTAYTLTIKKVKDLNGNTTASDIVLTFTTGDNTLPSVEDDTFAVNADGKIYIYFSEPMNATEMVKKANYLVKKTAAGSFAALGDDDTVTAVSDKIALIDIDGTVSSPSVQISINVVDLAGKKLTETSLVYTAAALTNIGQEVFTIDSAVATAKNKIKISFTKEVSAFDSADITVSAVTIAAVESVSGKDVVIVLSNDMTTDADGGLLSVNTAVGADGTKSVYGTEIQAPAAAKVVEDKIAPEVAKISGGTNDGKYNVAVAVVTGTVVEGTLDDGDTIDITVTFTENMDTASFSNLTYTVGGYKVISVTAAGNTAVIRAEVVDDETTVRPTVTQVYNVKDPNGNILSGASYESLY